MSMNASSGFHKIDFSLYVPFFSPKISLSAWVRPTIQKKQRHRKTNYLEKWVFFMFYIIPKYQKIPKSTEHITFMYQIKAGCYLRNHQTTWEWNLFLKSQFYIHTGSTIRNRHKVKTWLD